ncbi:hypothetical protein OAT84_03725 [Gammaproteobacteria bacterium]|nr:hypothetical protein [Gammaproteobacteria bacterium]
MASVKKYGGTSLKHAEQVSYIADQVRVGDVVVLSAAAGRTEQLITQTSTSDPSYSLKVGLGEMESCMRLYLACRQKGKSAIVVRYDQLGLYVESEVNPRIVKIDVDHIGQLRAQNQVVILPGFHATTLEGKHVLLSRGGSDETAVALAVGLDMPCIIHSDIAQIYDLNHVSLDKVSYNQLSAYMQGSESPMSRNAIRLAAQYHKEVVFTHWREICKKTIIC